MPRWSPAFDTMPYLAKNPDAFFMDALTTSSILPIALYGHPCLVRKADPVQGMTSDIRILIGKMFATMKNANGMGLAAPQVGVSQRIFVVDSSPLFTRAEEGVVEVFINPAIEKFFSPDSEHEEGCLSIPGIHENVRRPDGIKISYRDLSWKKIKRQFTGITSRIIQHEYDHLEGILITDNPQPHREAEIREKQLQDLRRGLVKAPYPLIIGPAPP